MTIRRFNFTHRTRINRSDARIALVESPQGLAFDALLNLTDYGLPPSARIVVEAYKSPALMRFDLGTVGSQRKPASALLSEFDPPDGVRFRLKVIAEGIGKGRLLAQADQLAPSDPKLDASHREPLITVEGVELADVVWRLVVEDGPDLPRLQINRMLGDWRAIARMPSFIWLVYPEVVRQILAFLLAAAPDLEDADDWRSKWLRFAMSLPGVEAPPEADADSERNAWIDDVVQAFCRYNGFRERFGRAIVEDGQ